MNMNENEWMNEWKWMNEWMNVWGIPLRARVVARVFTERGRLYVTSCAPSPKFLFATKARSYTRKWLLSLSGWKRVWYSYEIETMWIAKTASRLPVDWTLVHSVRRNESRWFVIAGSMYFSCLYRCRIQSFLDDARREAHNEVGLHVDAFIQAYAGSRFIGRLLNI